LAAVWPGAAVAAAGHAGGGGDGIAAAEGVMTFERSWVLLFLALPLVWALWEQRRARLVPGGVYRVWLKALTFAAVIAALAEPRIETSESKLAVAALVDTSASATARDLDQASRWANELESARGRNDLRVLPFARGMRRPAASEQGKQWSLQATAGEAGRVTDIESAVREASAGFPERRVPRLVLISDGKENRGSVARAAWQMRDLGIPIDVLPLEGRAQPALRLMNVNVPPQAFAGERFTVEMQVTAPRAARGTVQIAADGKKLGESPVELQPGENTLRAVAALTESGAFDLTGTIAAEGLGEVQFARALTLKRPRLLYISQDPDGTEVNLLKAVEAARFDVTRQADPVAAKLANYQMVALNNIDMEALPVSRKQELEDYVKAGGGLIVIGGEKNIYLEKEKDAPEDPLERALPAKLAPPRSPEGTCVILIVDKSSSMEGRKMDLARLAAIGVIENLRPIDQIGVLIFDNSFQWAVPIRKAEDKLFIKRLVGGVTPDGGTQIAPALSEAFRKTVPVKATFKHVVLLTDGISEEGDSISIAREAANLKITISTVGLGQDVNKAYLEKIASFSKGKSHFLVDPSGLEQILLRDVMEHTGSSAIERSTTPLVSKQVELLDGTGMDTAPALKGYVKFVSKPTAETILSIDAGTAKDPLLARWQYGLGRSVVFASDAKSRWAEDWVGWKGFDRFWTNIFRDLLPHAAEGESKVEFDPATSSLQVEYRLARGLEETKTIPPVYVLGPDNFRQVLPLQRTAAGVYQGKLPVGDRRGMFRIRPLEESKAFPETGFYRQEEELADYGRNEALLRQVAEYTGGRYNPPVKEIFAGTGRTVPATIELWPPLLGGAILLNLAELLLRKWRGLPFLAARTA